MRCSLLDGLLIALAVVNPVIGLLSFVFFRSSVKRHAFVEGIEDAGPTDDAGMSEFGWRHLGLIFFGSREIEDKELIRRVVRSRTTLWILVFAIFALITVLVIRLRMHC